MDYAENISGNHAPFTKAGLTRGIKANMAAVPAVIAFGIGFGATALEHDLPASAALGMSAFVFAGSAQYAVLELWGEPMPYIAIALITLALNARHIVLALTLRQYLARLGAPVKYLALSVLSDANWAASQSAIRKGDMDVAHLAGGGIALWVAWFIGTAVGVSFGQAIGSLYPYGIDVVMPAFFACALIGLTKGRAEMPALASSALVSALLAAVIALHWAILIGAAVGAMIGAWCDDEH
ncbi:AzlC family ABC transporter permease [Kordiimonas sp.]|uniref:AzlC family ABC transporter permease n=1 Tax=Kordiimonas sp. TaxID=1970157 RepID=UPI003A8F67DF